MTCYFRHFKGVFERAGIKVTPENRQELDKIIRTLVGTGCQNCPSTWKEVKKRIAEDERGFAVQLETAWNKHKR